MANIAKLQKKRNTLLLAPKRKLTSVVKPTTVDTTPVAPTAPAVSGSPLYVPPTDNATPTAPVTSVIAPPAPAATPAPAAPAAPAAPKTNPTTDALKKAAIIGGTTLAAKAIIDNYTKPAAPETKPAAPATKPAAPAPAPVVKPPTSVVIPPALQKEQDAQVKAANTAKAAADHNALAGSFDQGTKVGLPYNTIPNNTPARAGDVDDSMFKFGDVFTKENNRAPEVDEDISEEDADLFGYSPEEIDTGTELGLDYNTIPNNTPSEASTIDESMFDDPTGSAEPSPVMVQDEAGNLFLVNADGSYTPADADGNAMGDPIFAGGDEAGVGTEYADNNFSDTALDTEGSGGDDLGGGFEAYDEEGNLFFVGDDGSYTLLESAYEETPTSEYYEEPYYEEPPPYIEPDLSYLDDFTYEDPNYGYDYDSDLGYYEEPPAYYESDLSYLDDYKRGGQVQQMKKGGLPHFYTGGGAYDSLDEGYVDDYSVNNNNSAYFNTDDYDVNNTNSAYYNSNDYDVNNTVSGYYPNQASDMEESVFDPYDLSVDESLMQDEEGRKFAVNNETGDYRLLEDSKFPTNSDPRSPNTTPYPTATPKATSSGGSSFNYKDLFSTDNIKKLAGAGLGAAGLMTLYNSFKGNEPTYQPAAYTPPAIPKRTTDFGMGPARTVTPQMGGLQTMTPSQQEELYTNLGVAGYEREHEDPVEDPVADITEDQPMADGGFAQPQQPQSTAPSYFTYGMPQDPLEVLGIKQPQEKSQNGSLQMRQGGLPQPTAGVPIVQGRQDYRQGAAVSGEGDGQSDDIPAMLADGEYVFDSDVVAALGNGSNKAGAEVLDRFREEIRAHKRSAPVDKIPPKAKSPLAYMKEAT